MNPGALVPNVGLFEKVLVEGTVAQCFLKEGFVGAGRTGRHDHAIEVLFLDDPDQLVLGILRTGKQIFLNIGDIGKGFGIFNHFRHPHDVGNVYPTVADKNPDPRGFLPDVPLRGKRLFMNQSVARIGELACRGTGDRRRFHDRRRNVLGPLEHTTRIDPRSGCLHRRKAARRHEVVIVQFYTQLLGQLSNLGRRFQAGGKHDQVEFIFHLDAFVVYISKAQIVRTGNALHAMNTGTHKTDAQFLGAIVILFELLPVSTHVHKEDGGLQVPFGVFLGDDRFLDGIHAADARAVPVVAVIQLARSHALKPSNPFRLMSLCLLLPEPGEPGLEMLTFCHHFRRLFAAFFPRLIQLPLQLLKLFLSLFNFLPDSHIGRTLEMPAGGPTRTQQPFELHGSDHVGMVAVSISVKTAWIERLESSGENDGSHLQIQQLLLLFVIDGIRGTDLGANAALLAVSQLTAVFSIDGISRGDGLRIVFINGFAFAKSFIESIYHHSGTLFGARSTGNTFVQVHVSGFLKDFDPEMPFFTFKAFQLRIREKVDVQMPADLDQLGGDNSHCAIVGGKGLVQLRHTAPDGRAFFNKMDIIT